MVADQGEGLHFYCELGTYVHGNGPVDVAARVFGNVARAIGNLFSMQTPVRLMGEVARLVPEMEVPGFYAKE